MENRDTLLLFRHFFCRYFKRVRSTAIWLRVLSGLTSFFIFLAFLFFFLFFVDLRFVKKEKKDTASGTLDDCLQIRRAKVDLEDSPWSR